MIGVWYISYLPGRYKNTLYISTHALRDLITSPHSTGQIHFPGHVTDCLRGLTGMSGGHPFYKSVHKYIFENLYEVHVLDDTEYK